jgi:hypothetical protein
MTTLDQNRENQRESFAKRNGWYIKFIAGSTRTLFRRWQINV